MGKVVVSPVKAIPGSITLISPVPLDPYLDWVDTHSQLGESKRIKEQIAVMLPAVCELIEVASIEGLPANPTPADFGKLKPGAAAMELVIWLIGECRQIVAAEDNPNA